MEQQIREQIAHLQRESRFLRNLAGGILLYSIVTSYFLKVPFLSPLGFLFAVFLYLSARDIYKDADAQQPENWSSPEQFLEVSRQIREEIVEMEQRLQESRQYIGQPKEQLEVEIIGENDV